MVMLTNAPMLVKAPEWLREAVEPAGIADGGMLAK
jgi:hypothetical protein